MLKIDADKMGLKFNIYVQPRSSRNQVVGLHGDALKIKIILLKGMILIDGISLTPPGIGTILLFHN